MCVHGGNNARRPWLRLRIRYVPRNSRRSQGKCRLEASRGGLERQPKDGLDSLTMRFLKGF